MRRISLELDGAAIARLGDDTASRGAFATRGRVIVRDAGDRFVRRDEIRNELLDSLLAASNGGRGGAGGAQNLEELAAFDARGPRGLGHGRRFRRKDRTS